jgi:hypothetical protein
LFVVPFFIEPATFSVVIAKLKDTSDMPIDLDLNKLPVALELLELTVTVTEDAVVVEGTFTEIEIACPVLDVVDEGVQVTSNGKLVVQTIFPMLSSGAVPVFLNSTLKDFDVPLLIEADSSLLILIS